MSIQQLLEQYGSEYLSALFTTWKLTAVSFSLAFVIGIVVTIMRISPIRPLNAVGEFYVQIFRNVSGTALLMLVVYALPYLGKEFAFSFYTCILWVCILIPAAFCSEYLMSGMNTIGKGQLEAARALGLSFMQIIFRIVLPQALRSSVLPLTNLAVATMLTTALASQVPLKPTDLTGIVSYINTHAVGGVTAFVISALLYLSTALLIGWIGNKIDRKVRILR